MYNVCYFSKLGLYTPNRQHDMKWIWGILDTTFLDQTSTPTVRGHRFWLICCISPPNFWEDSSDWTGGNGTWLDWWQWRPESSLHPPKMNTSRLKYWFTGWWFGTFFIFHNIWDNPSHWLSYFSRWLKPPTSLILDLFILGSHMLDGLD